MRWISLRALSGPVLLFCEKQPGGLHLLGCLSAMCKATTTLLVLPAVWKEEWTKAAEEKEESFAHCLPSMQLCWCQYNSLRVPSPKPGKVTKVREGMRCPAIGGCPCLPSRCCRSAPVNFTVALWGPRRACLCPSLEDSFDSCLQKVKPGTCKSDSY